MEDIMIPMEIVSKNKLTIQEYLVLYDIINQYPVSHLLGNVGPTLAALESKGFIKIKGGELFLRNKTVRMFEPKEDIFTKWLEVYPTRVTNRFGTKRALSPASENTILGKKLRRKWNSVFRKNIKAQEEALKVLEAMVKHKKRTGELEFMVEATRWLNEGYHQKYSFLIEDDVEENRYTNEDYM